VIAAIERFDDGEVFLAFRAPLEQYSYSYRGDELVHAASTMKIAVMLGLFEAAAAGELRLDDRVTLRNEFASIMDGAPYSLLPSDDSDPELYTLIGAEVALQELCRRMIVRSSNLATNVLVEIVGSTRIQQVLQSVGATRMRVLRGVEDGPAFRAGWSNLATADDLARQLSAIAFGCVLDQGTPLPAFALLASQEFNELIPAALPPGYRAAHKTGSITAILHDAAIVVPEEPGPMPYVIVVLTRGFPSEARAAEAIRAVARAVHDTRPRALLGVD